MKKIIFLFIILITTSLVVYSQITSLIHEEDIWSPNESREKRKGYKSLEVYLCVYEFGKINLDNKSIVYSEQYDKNGNIVMITGKSKEHKGKNYRFVYNYIKDTLVSEEKFYEPETTLKYRKQIEYNKNNLPITRKEYDSKENLLVKEEVEYDKNNLPVETNMFLYNRLMSIVSIFRNIKEYNENGVLIKQLSVSVDKKDNSSTGQSVEYDHNGKMVLSIEFEDDDIVDYISYINKYDDDNNLIERTASDGKKTVRIYDENKNLLEITEYLKGQLKNKLSYKYNDDGLKMEERLHGDSSLTYEYNTKDMLIKRIHYSKFNEPASETIYEYK